MKLKALFVSFVLAIAVSSPAHARSSTQAAFSPSPQAIKLVERTIRHAEHSVDVAAYSFSSQKIANALIEAHKRGVVVRVVLDKSHAKRRYPAVTSLHDAGIPLRINRRYAIMHDKYIIIDGKTVETGSFNYTTNAERHNAENVVVIKNNKTLAKRYIENWQKLWDEADSSVK